MPSSKSPTKPRANQPQLHHEWAFEAIGTHFWIGMYEPFEPDKLRRLQQEITERIEVFDKNYSRFRDDSLVTRIAREAGTYDLPKDAAKLISFYEQLYKSTNGRVTPLIGQALADAGYDAKYSLQPKTLSAVPKWSEVCSFNNGQLTTTQPVLLDFGAAGKGYLVDLLSGIMQNIGINHFCIDGSGDMLCRGLSAPLTIGLENPHDTSQVIGVAQLANGALCGSSATRRTWSDYSHILDPKLLASPNHIAAVWVVADSCMLADGLTTALYFAEPAELRRTFSFEYAIMFADSIMDYSADFPAELFIVEPSHA
jgi:thiamine biosynthesis lipoprotein